MTSLAVLVAKDSKKVSAVYLATDSRISFASQSWDFGRKTFASTRFPDIYAYCGDVVLPSLFLGQFIGALDRGLVASRNSTFADRFEMMQERLSSAVAGYPVLTSADTTVVCCGRDGESASAFTVGVVTVNKSKELQVLAEPVPDNGSQLLLSYGSGSNSVRDAVKRWQYDDGTVTTRATFSAFVESIGSGSDPHSGGAPQLVGVYNSFAAQEFGLTINGRPYFRGLEFLDPLDSDVEWRNEFFERTDQYGKRLTGAAQHENRAPR